MAHTDFYGKYGIAFSKRWCVEHNLQPVHYVNSESSFTHDIASAFEEILKDDDVNSMIVDNMLNTLSFLKPLQGSILRTIDREKVYYSKNFHDEREWRYIPPVAELNKVGLERIIYKEYIQNDLNAINDGIATEEYKRIGLSFCYKDIKYLVVPDEESRERVIEGIMISSEDSNEEEAQKLILISKIIVLTDAIEDF